MTESCLHGEISCRLIKKKRRRAMHAASYSQISIGIFFFVLPTGLSLDVDVVADHRPQYAAGRRADDGALDLVTTRHTAEDRTSRRSDRRVSTRVLLDSRRRSRRRIIAAATAAGARGSTRATHGRRSPNGRAAYRLPRSRLKVLWLGRQTCLGWRHELLRIIWLSLRCQCQIALESIVERGRTVPSARHSQDRRRNENRPLHTTHCAHRNLRQRSSYESHWLVGMCRSDH